MKKKIKLFMICAISILALSSCKMTTKQLTKEIKQHMTEEYKKDGVTVVDLSELVHKGGNEYTGIVTLESEGDKVEMNVDVTYDGNSFKWECKQ